MENKDDWSSLFKPSDFFQKYKYVIACTFLVHWNCFLLSFICIMQTRMNFEFLMYSMWSVYDYFLSTSLCYKSVQISDLKNVFIAL